MNSLMQVCRLDFWISPVFDEMIRSHPQLALQVMPRQGDDARTLAALRNAHAYHVSAAKDELPAHWFANQALIEQCPHLLCVSSGGAGFDTVDVAACTRAGIAVVNQAGANAHSVAEHTFGLLLAVVKRIVESDHTLRHAKGFSREDLMGEEIHGRTIGLIGLGEIGGRVARIAHGFGLDVLAYDPHLNRETIQARGATPVTLAELLQRSDFVSLHCPLDAGTRHLMGADQFAAMKPGAVFLSTARGGIHDEAALFDALKKGQLSGAGLDVWACEPPPHHAPLLSLTNVVATFHTAGVTHGGRRNVARSSAAQIAAILRGERPPHLLNPEVWEVVSERINAR
ncbi:hydroxyacid dehydrogenase [Pseudomonas tolaasii]|uniref:hydroxyacid dehydrogenase n=1 Tax=Pseudomonas tolaasii TaxID=29442 RepID=UPI0015A0CAFA|nr:hydroxyacid dehydrogenase [Pseudomonas tolaasii]NWC29592.1 hydroxyacid dehydrogenase [Pseudomonas tolaasii]NWC54779.1 hydroxyacid dehydrogenase [Pseudomonas tolaasii]NWE64864.1 hydroxyacid dehydrogenase [Pseudomonas tolaasii]